MFEEMSFKDRLRPRSKCRFSSLEGAISLLKATLARRRGQLVVTVLQVPYNTPVQSQMEQISHLLLLTRQRLPLGLCFIHNCFIICHFQLHWNYIQVIKYHRDAAACFRSRSFGDLRNCFFLHKPVSPVPRHVALPPDLGCLLQLWPPFVSQTWLVCSKKRPRGLVLNPFPVDHERPSTVSTASWPNSG